MSAAAVVGTFGALLIAVPTLSAATPPPNPTDGQLNAAAATKNALAKEVGVLSGQIAQAQANVQRTQDAAELAEQKYAYAEQKKQEATAAAAKARANVAAARRTVAKAQEQLIQFVGETYTSGDDGSTAESLLTASDPDAVLERSAIEQYQTDHQIDAVGTMQRATVGKSNADTAAQLALAAKKKAVAAAAVAREQAVQAANDAAAQEAQFESLQASTQSKLSAAQQRLADLNGQRAAYNKYEAHQAYLRHQAELRREEEARKRAEAIARQRAEQGNGGGGGGGGGTNSGGSVPIAPGGSSTSAKAHTAVERAMSMLGVPYSWDGGNSFGPTYGVCVAGDAWNDCHVRGFDCSGLVMYAWGPYLSLPHYAASQYVLAGSYHPSPGDLRPGDLVFWSDGGASAIHHVAIYIGGGQIIEAPNSGMVIRTASLYEYGSYFFTTRPLS